MAKLSDKNKAYIAVKVAEGVSAEAIADAIDVKIDIVQDYITKNELGLSDALKPKPPEPPKPPSLIEMMRVPAYGNKQNIHVMTDAVADRFPAPSSKVDKYGKMVHRRPE